MRSSNSVPTVRATSGASSPTDGRSPLVTRGSPRSRVRDPTSWRSDPGTRSGRDRRGQTVVESSAGGAGTLRGVPVDSEGGTAAVTVRPAGDRTPRIPTITALDGVVEPLADPRRRRRGAPSTPSSIRHPTVRIRSKLVCDAPNRRVTVVSSAGRRGAAGRARPSPVAGPAVGPCRRVDGPIRTALRRTRPRWPARETPAAAAGRSARRQWPRGAPAGPTGRVRDAPSGSRAERPPRSPDRPQDSDHHPRREATPPRRRNGRHSRSAAGSAPRG